MISETSRSLSKGKLLSALNEWGRQKFDYGLVDCCQFTAFIAYKMTGIDYSKGFVYDSKKQAYQIISEHGDLIDLFCHILGYKPNGAINDGDPCIIELEGLGQVAGVKYGDEVICLLDRGFAKLPKETIKASWNLCPM